MINYLFSKKSRLYNILKLKESPRGKRTLYSLRHTYVTLQLMKKILAQVIATQCGTSIQILEQHYSHVMPEMFTAELTGIDLSEDPIEQIYEDDPIITAETIKWIKE
ncbi:hypothetical protein [Sessilibacter corallicola]|uniref:HTH merR-type domain-containing protein n=1 Tax=Sessilibacter corallicola TaxID=2904075 RepID=A0ABQ0A860_9GAMM